MVEKKLKKQEYETEIVETNGHATFKKIGVVDAARLYEQNKQLIIELGRVVSSTDQLYTIMADVVKEQQLTTSDLKILKAALDAYCKEQVDRDKKIVRKKLATDSVIAKKKVDIEAKKSETENDIKKTKALSDAEIRKIRIELIKDIAKIAAFVLVALYFGIEGAIKAGLL